MCYTELSTVVFVYLVFIRKVAPVGGMAARNWGPTAVGQMAYVWFFGDKQVHARGGVDTSSSLPLDIPLFGTRGVP